MFVASGHVLCLISFHIMTVLLCDWVVVEEICEIIFFFFRA